MAYEIFRVEITIAKKKISGKIKAAKWDIIERTEKDLLEYDFDAYNNVGNESRKLNPDNFCPSFIQDMFTILFESGDVRLRPS